MAGHSTATKGGERSLQNSSKEFSRVWWVFSGLGKFPLCAKVMSNIDGQELY